MLTGFFFAKVEWNKLVVIVRGCRYGTERHSSGRDKERENNCKRQGNVWFVRINLKSFFFLVLSELNGVFEIWKRWKKGEDWKRHSEVQILQSFTETNARAIYRIFKLKKHWKWKRICEFLKPQSNFWLVFERNLKKVVEIWWIICWILEKFEEFCVFQIILTEIFISRQILCFALFMLLQGFSCCQLKCFEAIL